MEYGDIIILLILLATAGAALRASLRNGKGGKSCGSCDGNCSCCRRKH